MAKFPTEVERSVVVSCPLKRAYTYLWDVIGSSECIGGLDRCEKAGKKDTYRFIYQERSAGPVSMLVRYTSRYKGNGKDHIEYESIGADGDNAEVQGSIDLTSEGRATRITLRQMVAPETPIPRLVQGFVKSFVEREAAAEVERYLVNVKQRLEKTT